MKSKLGSKVTVSIFVSVVLIVLAAGSALADWTAYNDCVWTSMGNVTNISAASSPAGTTTGTLVNYADGSTLSGVTVTMVTTSGIAGDISNGGTLTSGTDAYNVFANKLAPAGIIYTTENNNATLAITISGLDPGKLYQFVSYANRGGSGGDYSQRSATFTLSGASSFVNASSSGVAIANNGASSTYCTGDNTTNGYVARWTDIVCNGSFTVTSARAASTPSTLKSYFTQVFMVSESSPVPEPTSFMALGVGLLGLVGKKLRRK